MNKEELDKAIDDAVTVYSDGWYDAEGVRARKHATLLRAMDKAIGDAIAIYTATKES